MIRRIGKYLKLLRKMRESRSRWQRYDENRQSLMRGQLQRILDADVSKDVFEVASRSLAV